MKARVALNAIVLMLVASSSLASDWPQYLGPNRNSTSPEKGILRSWPEGGPKVLWTVTVGRGFGGPVVKDGKVYLLDRVPEKADHLRCFDLATGKELWKFAYDAPGAVMFPGSRSVPTVDGDRVYSCGHNGDFYCIDVNTHKPVWHKNIWTDFGGTAADGSTGGQPRQPRTRNENIAVFPVWAITQNPLIYNDLVVVASQAPEAGVVAYEKLTGKVRWKTPSLGLVGYVSPAVVKIDGKDQLVMITPSTNPFRRSTDVGFEYGNVVGIHPLSGEILWKYSEWKCHVSVSSAVDAGDNKVLVVGGYELGAVMIKVEKKADGSYGATELFKTEEFGDQTKPPILHNGYFYAQFGTNSRRDGMACMSMDGKIMWKTKRSPDFNKGSMIFVDGLILSTDGSTKLYLIEPDPKAFRQIASAELFAVSGGTGGRRRGMFGSQNWAPLALADGNLLVRDQSRLKCVKVGK